MIKLLDIGNHPLQRLQMFHMLFADWKKTREHYHECEEHCFAQMVYAELPQRVAPLILGFAVGGLVSHLLRAQSTIFLLIIAVLLWGMGRFASIMFTYADMYERHKRAKAILEGTEKLPSQVLDLIKKQFGGLMNVEQVGSTVEDDDQIAGMIKLTPIKPPEDEDPTAKIIRESNALARQRAEERKKQGGV